MFSMLPASGLGNSSGLFRGDMGPCGHTGLKRVRTTCDTYPTALLCRGGMYPNSDPLRSSILMSDNTKHLAKKCVKDAGPCLALCAAGAAVALLAVLGPFDVLRSASSLHVCMALAAAMMTGGVLDLIFWVLDPFGWKNEG